MYYDIVQTEALKNSQSLLIINPNRRCSPRRTLSTRVDFRLANRNRIFPLGYAVLVHAFVPRRSIELVTIVAGIMDDAPDRVVGIVFLDGSIHRWVGLRAVHWVVLSVCLGTGPGARLGASLVSVIVISLSRRGFRLTNRNWIFPLGYAVLVHAFVPRRSIELVTIVAGIMDDAPDRVVGVVLLDGTIHRWVGLRAVHGVVLSVCLGTGPSAGLVVVIVIYVSSGGYDH